MRGAVAVVVDHQRALAAVAVGVGKDVFVDRAVALEEVVEQEVAALGKEPAALEQRRNFAVVALDQPRDRASRRSAASGTPCRTFR